MKELLPGLVEGDLHGGQSWQLVCNFLLAILIILIIIIIPTTITIIIIMITCMGDKVGKASARLACSTTELEDLCIRLGPGADEGRGGAERGAIASPGSISI